MSRWFINSSNKYHSGSTYLVNWFINLTTSTKVFYYLIQQELSGLSTYSTSTKWFNSPLSLSLASKAWTHTIHRSQHINMTENTIILENKTQLQLQYCPSARCQVSQILSLPLPPPFFTRFSFLPPIFPLVPFYPTRLPLLPFPQLVEIKRGWFPFSNNVFSIC